MFTTVLIAHIAGAGLTALVSAYACLTVVVRNERAYRMTAISLGTLAAFEVVTGTVLAVLSSSVTVLSVCGNIALYLALVGLVQSLLYMRISQVSHRFPSVEALAPVSAGIVFIAFALALGF